MLAAGLPGRLPHDLAVHPAEVGLVGVAELGCEGGRLRRPGRRRGYQLYVRDYLSEAESAQRVAAWIAEQG